MIHDTPNAVLRNPKLPTLPAIAVQVLELTSKRNADIRQIGRVIQNDQALAAKIVKTVNSSYFGLARPCADVNQATVYLGLNTVKTLALGFSLVQCVDDSDEWQVNFNYVDYWRRSMHAAAAAREIARLTRAWDAEEAFLAALLQDLGMIAFFHAYGDTYLQAIDLTDGDHSKLPAIERRALKMDHAEIGAALAAKWKLPEQLVEAVRYHHGGDQAPSQWRALARIVELAVDAAAFTAKVNVNEALSRITTHGSEWFNLDTNQIQAMLHKMSETAAELSTLFRVDLGGPANIDEILAQAEDAQIRNHLELVKRAEQAEAAAESARSDPPSEPVAPRVVTRAG